MFDSKILINRTEFIPYEKTIIEKRAPTDESIRLWNEIKEKAYASILDTIELKSNTLALNAIAYFDHLSYRKVLRYKIILNGESFTGDISLDLWDYTKTELIRKIVDEVSKRISIQIMEMLIKEKTFE